VFWCASARVRISPEVVGAGPPCPASKVGALNQCALRMLEDAITLTITLTLREEGVRTPGRVSPMGECVCAEGLSYEREVVLVVEVAGVLA
jgi:hypothetical protein